MLDRFTAVWIHDECQSDRLHGLSSLHSFSSFIMDKDVAGGVGRGGEAGRQDLQQFKPILSCLLRCEVTRVGRRRRGEERRG